MTVACIGNEHAKEAVSVVPFFKLVCEKENKYAARRQLGDRFGSVQTFPLGEGERNVDDEFCKISCLLFVLSQPVFGF